MDLFYVSPQQIDLGQGKVVIEGDEFHHAARVLRKKPGDIIQLADGCGLHVEACIDTVGRHSLEGKVVHSSHAQKSGSGVTVAISLLKVPQRFDFFLEKSTELGVSAIIPMITARTVSIPSHERIERKAERWRNVVLAAARQCKRYYLPEIHEPRHFDQALELEGYDLKLIPYESSIERPEMDVSGKQVLFLIGGEGGFTRDEIRSARLSGFREISFGQSVLRAETAGIFAVALVRSMLLENAATDQWL
jgi:16S rRNA (uracil1498-N3)-methyltransferase